MEKEVRMKTKDARCRIVCLTELFYKAYPSPPYVEILKKSKRAYSCLSIQISHEYFVCIPYRTDIPHKYAYHFRQSKRSILHRSGLDYTKIILHRGICELSNG